MSIRPINWRNWLAVQLKQALRQGIEKLTHTDSPLLDAQLLLAHVLGKSRSYLMTWPEQELSPTLEKQYQALLKARQDGQPIAYLTGRREFWDFELQITPAVLIPRPETELLVELTLQKIRLEQAHVADLGTGSGAIALALAGSRPAWRVIATDISPEALALAQANAEKLGLREVEFRQGAWCEALKADEKLDAIVANPPYIDTEDKHLQLGDVRFEPRSALVAEEQGLADLRQIVQQARGYLKPGGLLLLEHGYQQAAAVQKLFLEYGYNTPETHQDLAGLDRVSLARH